MDIEHWTVGEVQAIWRESREKFHPCPDRPCRPPAHLDTVSKLCALVGSDRLEVRTYPKHDGPAMRPFDFGDDKPMGGIGNDAE